MVFSIAQNGKLLSMNNTKKENILILFGADSKLQWGRSYQLAKAFAKNGHEVLYVDLPNPVQHAFDKTKYKTITTNNNVANLKVFRPSWGLPYVRFKLLRPINYYIILQQILNYLEKNNFIPTILWIYSPYDPDIGHEIINKHKPNKVVYDCADERLSFAELYGGEKARKAVEMFELEIAKYVDVVITITENLRKNKEKIHEKIIVIPNGIDIAMFSNKSNFKCPECIRNLPGKKILYLGTIAKWVDLDLIESCALKFPLDSFVFVGSCETDVKILNKHKNIYFIGPVPYCAVPAYIYNSDVGIIPFKSDGMIKYSNTLKALQYLCVGKPVLSTYYDGVEDYFGTVNIAATEIEFIEKLDLILSSQLKVTSPDLNKIINNYSWDMIASRALSELYTISKS